MGKKLHSLEEKDFMKALGFNIKKLRTKYQITQAELAARMDMSTQTLSDIENGKSDCQQTTSYLIAKSLGVELYELYIFNNEEEES